MRPTTRFRLILSLAPVLALLTVSGSALAAANHPFLGVVGSAGYEDACGVGLFGGGVYVSDYLHGAIDMPSGSISPSDGACKLAFDATGDLYVNEWHRAVVKYPSSELEAGAQQVVDEAQPTGVAVEVSSGNVFVAHRTYVAEYDSAGALVATIGAGNVGEAYGVAVSEYPATAGDLYVPDAATHTVKIFDPATSLTTPIGELSGAATPQGEFRHLVDAEAVVDNNPTSPSYGHLYVLDAVGHGLSDYPEAVLDEFNSAGEYRGQIAGFTDAEPSGVAIEPASGNVLVTSGNSEGSALFKYGPTAPARRLAVTRSGAGSGRVTSTPNGISCGEACAAEFNEGQTVTLFANPDGHSAFASWTVTGAEPCPGKGPCTVLMSKNVEVTAQFEEPVQRTLTVGLSGSGQGTVTSEPTGIECPGHCEEHFAQGRQVTLTARPAPHSRFAEWLGVACDEGTQPTCQITMSQAESITARFEPIPQVSLSVTKSGSGQGTVTSYPAGIECPGTCSHAFDQGSTAYLMAAPSPGSGFGGFSGAGCSGTATICAVTMSSAASVTAEFTGAARGPAGPSSVGATALKVGRVETRGPVATLHLTVAESGTAVAAGPRVRPLTRKLSAGAASIRVRLNRRGAALFDRRSQLSVPLTLGFVPVGRPGGQDTRVALRFRRHDQTHFDRKGR